jgi:alpha-mannosidase
MPQKSLSPATATHYCNRIAASPKAGEKIDLALEYYAGHYVMGELPFQTRERSDFRFPFNKLEICTKNEEIADFFFDLQTILSLYSALDDKSYRKAELENVFVELHKVLFYSPENVSREEFMAAIRKGKEILAPAMAKTNGNTTVPYAGIIGHSHMDTAWLWHIAETIKKCARTYSNQMNLMEQYPEYKFVQSSSYHSEMIREHYPELFERIAKQVAAGRYEPNGGVWVECDCNVTSGESMIRQFLWGQRFTRQYFNYTSDCFWLPDTFGYSAAIPQIMKGCGVDYFLTTKIAWNDTNPFPYDSFYWKGIDGTKVFSHFNKTHIGTAPHELMPLFYDTTNNDSVRQKSVSKSKLVSYGYGDGGGGPQWDQIEITRRCKDLEGCPKYEYTTVSDFMRKLEKEVQQPAVYEGELYLELHRGTLTNQHEIKRNNRLGEIALHDLELATVSKAVLNGSIATDNTFRHLQNRLLVNQFHDILPGTCIPRANRESKEEMGELLVEAKQLLDETAAASGDEAVTVLNSTSFERNDVIYMDDTGKFVDGATCQRITKLDGSKKLAVANVTLPPLAAVTLDLTDEGSEGASPFAYKGNVLETPFATVTFTEEGTISSFYDKRAHRELVGEGYPLNTFLLAEDVPLQWDNWDIDADVELKLKPVAKLLSEEVVSDGAVEFRMRRKYQLTEKSSITQDMIFFANSPKFGLKP